MKRFGLWLFVGMVVPTDDVVAHLGLEGTLQSQAYYSGVIYVFENPEEYVA